MTFDWEKWRKAAKRLGVALVASIASTATVFAAESAFADDAVSSPSVAERALPAPRLADRWFYASFGVESDERADELAALIRRASAVGFNGVLWSCGVENYSRWDDARKARLAKIRAVADEEKVEIIPILWSIGYGTALGFDQNLAEGLPVRGLPARAVDGRVEAVATPVDVPNGSLESWKKNSPTDYVFNDQPGTISFRDDDVARSGSASIRFENFAADKHGHGRLMKEIQLAPSRLYRASVWFRTENVRGNLMLQIYDENGAPLGSARPKYDAESATDWTRVSAVFRAPEEGKTRLYAGVWDGEDGRFWVDDLTVEPVGLVNPLRRPGTPLVVADAESGTVYEEGKDWVLPDFSLRLWNPNAESQTLTLPEGSRIKDGQALKIDYYYPPLVGAPQIGTCMSEPKLYEFFEESARGVVEALAPKKWFLSMDEIRCAGTCAACKARGISLAEILADCVAKQRKIIRETTPDAEIYIWSDMLDPKHNARDNYYVCDGSYVGVWDLIPKDLIISCWYYEIREDSMKFFSERGFRTQAAAYYDVDSLDTSLDWLETCARTPGCVGIMYTTWRKKYELLEGFGRATLESPLPKE